MKSSKELLTVALKEQTDAMSLLSAQLLNAELSVKNLQHQIVVTQQTVTSLKKDLATLEGKKVKTNNK